MNFRIWAESEFLYNLRNNFISFNLTKFKYKITLSESFDWEFEQIMNYLIVNATFSCKMIQYSIYQSSL